MRTKSTPLLAIFRSRLQGELLALVYLRASTEPLSVSDLATSLRAPVSSVAREINRLVESGLLDERRVGRSRLVSTPQTSPVTRPLTDLLAVTFGPLPVLTDLLAQVESIDRAFIYGSWAARYQGTAGPPPGDIDVLLVGRPLADDVDAVAETAETQLRREVNIRVVRPARWADPDGDAFIATVGSRPMVPIPLPADSASS